MTDNTDNMVLRTIYLPKDLDQALKSAAIRGARSKGDVIRDLILTGLSEKQKDPTSFFVESKSVKKRVHPNAPKATVVKKAVAKKKVVRGKDAAAA